jgi:branched-chain amino acid transport system permease protein
MSFAVLGVQAINGLANASSLFFLAAGLSLIFGVSRIVNMAHGSFYMLGAYIAYSFADRFAGALGFWGGMAATTLIVALLGALLERLLLRRIYHVPELFQLLATFAVVMVVSDGVLALWGSADLLGPRAPGLGGAVRVFGRRIPEYDIFLIIAGPLVLGAVHLALHHTRWGILVRAATEDRDMVGALGVNQARLFTAVFALGSALAGLGGALQIAREPANLGMDLNAIGDAFVVVVVGGLGSMPGAFLAALLVAEVNALCIGIGVQTVFGLTLNASKLTLVAEFLVMAVVLVVRPYGLLGRPAGPARHSPAEAPVARASGALKAAGALGLAALLLLPLATRGQPYALVLGIDVLIAVLFAASLQFIMGPGGMHSFGHAAYFGLGAYGAALSFKLAGLPMLPAIAAGTLLAGLGGLVFGWFAVRLSGVYLAMLTLAFAQIVWSIVFQWEAVTGGSNGINGVWATAPFDQPWANYLLVLAAVVLGLALLRRMVFAPFGRAVRAGRDSPQRAEAIGIHVHRVHWIAFAIAGCLCGVAGSLFAFAKGSISPEAIHVSRSIDGLIMVLLGGLHSLSGPVVGAGLFTLLQDHVMRETAYWRGVLGVLILALVLAFPGGIAGSVAAAWSRAGRRLHAARLRAPPGAPAP